MKAITSKITQKMLDAPKAVLILEFKDNNSKYANKYYFVEEHLFVLDDNAPLSKNLKSYVDEKGKKYYPYCWRRYTFNTNEMKLYKDTDFTPLNGYTKIQVMKEINDKISTSSRPVVYFIYDIDSLDKPLFDWNQFFKQYLANKLKGYKTAFYGKKPRHDNITYLENSVRKMF